MASRHKWMSVGLLTAAAVSLGAFSSALPVAAIHYSASTATVAHLVFSPDPIGSSVKTGPSTVLKVLVTAEDSTKAPIPGATIYLSFHQAIGGGTAFVGSTLLGLKARPLIADATGSVTITYTTPPTMPSQGVDFLHAQNGATIATSAIKVNDPFCYSAITAMGFTPSPIARAASLGVHQTVPVTLTVFKSGGVPAAGATVYLHIKQTAGGGSAVVGTTPLTNHAQGFVTDVNGQVHVAYTTPSILPSTGVDVIIAGNETTLSCASARDGYSFV